MKLQQHQSINEGARAMTMFFSKKSHCDDLGPRTLTTQNSQLKIIQDIVILHVCGKLNQNSFMNEGSGAIMFFFFFSKNSHCDLDLGISLLFVKSHI